MSRAFNGGTAADCITFAAGAAPTQQGPITVAVLAKAASLTGWTGNMVKGKQGASNSWALLTTNNGGPKLFCENDFGNGVGGLTTSWAWYVYTKASGSAIPRFHVYPIGGSWTHTDDSNNVGNNFGPIDTIYVGGDGSGAANQSWRGSIAVVAAWGSVLTDTQIAAAMTLNAADTHNYTTPPDWMIRLNQASTATAVTDDMGHGGSQTAISGTSIDADDPPGYNYSLSAPGEHHPTTGNAGVGIAGTSTFSGVHITSGTARFGIAGTSYSSGGDSGLGANYDLNDIMDALAALFQGVPTGETIGGVPVLMEAHSEVVGRVDAPAIVLEMDDQTWDLTMAHGADTIQIVALLLIAYRDEENSQRTLRSFLSRKAGSGLMRLKSVLESDSTLGGRVSYAVMTGLRTIGIINYSGTNYMGAELTIEVMS